MKNKNIYITSTVVLSMLMSFCGNSNQPSQPEKKVARTGQQAFEQTCAVCHGTDGKSNIAGAALLDKSILPESEIINQIKHGKNTMPANLLTDEEEIKAVAAYVITLRK